MPQNCKPIEFANVVATCETNCRKLDLRKIYQNCRNADYNPTRFPAVILRITSPKTTAMIFSKGKLVITGAKSEVQALSAAKIFVKIISKVLLEQRQQHH